MIQPEEVAFYLMRLNETVSYMIIDNFYTNKTIFVLK